MLKNILNFLYLKVYENGKMLHKNKVQQDYRNRYVIDASFRFNGDGIRFYGEGEIKCGKNSYIGELSTIQAYTNCKVSIGNNCSISHNVRIYTQSSIADQDFSTSLANKVGNVIIEDNVWVGANVFINPGVVIGENSIIGSNAVITKSVEAFSIVGGVPAKLIRMKVI